MLTDETIEWIISRIIKSRQKVVDLNGGEEAYLDYLKVHGIELEFTPDGVVWKRNGSA